MVGEAYWERWLVRGGDWLWGLVHSLFVDIADLCSE